MINFTGQESSLLHMQRFYKYLIFKLIKPNWWVKFPTSLEQKQ
jgi:hypothetical protein